MTHLRSVPDPAPEAPEPTRVGPSRVIETAPHPPEHCIKCRAPVRVTTETREPNGMHRTFLLCSNHHGMAVTWGENS